MCKVIFLPMLITLAAALLALSACGATSAGDPTPPPAATSAPAATVGAVQPTEPPTLEPPTAAAEPPTLEPPTTAAEPPTATPEPPTATPEPPTPTLEPILSNTIPGNGEYDDGNPYNTTANDPGVGPNDGDGIESVTFQFSGPDSQEVYSHIEKTPRYCAFGGGDNGQDCNRWIFSDHNNQWPGGKPAQSGQHKLIVTIRGVRGGTAQDQRNVTLNLDEELTLEVTLSPTSGSFGDELAFETAAHDLSIGGGNGAGIASVKFQFFDSQGQVVHERIEKSVRYCAFGGGDNEQDCNVWRFSEHNNQWPSGTVVENGGAYSLRVTVDANSGKQASQELNFTIQL